jgi:small multidrug resistance family-3 protein
MIKTFALFVIAALAEVGGAYLVWQTVRGGRPLWFAALGAAFLIGYALIQTTQSFNFGRAFAAYGGTFIAVALLWGWLIDAHAPDGWDWIGVAICLVGVMVMIGIPRN